MPLAALIVPILLGAADAPINVVGHAWAPFISPMGEPFRARSASDDTLAAWFRQADRNRDGVLTADEMQADADRFFAVLDADHNGEIEPDELAHYEYEVAPDIQVMTEDEARPPRSGAGSAPRGGSGRGRPTTWAPTRSGRQRPTRDWRRASGRRQIWPAQHSGAGRRRRHSISIAAFLSEFRQAAAARFALLDSGHAGGLTLGDLEARRAAAWAERGSKRKADAPDRRVGNPLPAGNLHLRATNDFTRPSSPRNDPRRLLTS